MAWWGSLDQSTNCRKCFRWTLLHHFQPLNFVNIFLNKVVKTFVLHAARLISTNWGLVTPNNLAVVVWHHQTQMLCLNACIPTWAKKKKNELKFCMLWSSLNCCRHAWCECILTPLHHHPLTAHVTFIVKKIWLVMGLMITDDGVDDDSDAVSGNNDYDNIEGCHCSDTWNHSSLVNDYIFS